VERDLRVLARFAGDAEVGFELRSSGATAGRVAREPQRRCAAIRLVEPAEERVDDLGVTPAPEIYFSPASLGRGAALLRGDWPSGQLRGFALLPGPLSISESFRRRSAGRVYDQRE
jgi:hypothetical protein